MATAVNNTEAVYVPPRGSPIYGTAGLEPYDCCIVSVGPTNLVCAFVRAPAGTGPYTSWVAENVPYIDGDTDPADVPVYGNYVAPLGWVVPEPPAPAPDPVSSTGDALIPGQVIWVSPDEKPTTTALTTPLDLPLN